MTQPSLLDIPETRQKKRGSVRRSSVLTYQAEHGLIGIRAERARHAVKWWPDDNAPAAAELAAQWWRGAFDGAEFKVRTLEVRRGLSDAQEYGVVERVPNGDRKCRISGRTCATWRLKERG